MKDYLKIWILLKNTLSILEFQNTLNINSPTNLMWYKLLR